MSYQNLETPAPGVWQSRDPTHCCIYRVPSRIREAKPEAYTPQFVIIGPLHYPLIAQALRNRGDITNARAMDYLNMQAHKIIYRDAFQRRLQDDDDDTLKQFKDAIRTDEGRIRASYSESTAWIPHQEFVDMIYLDSVFILELLLRTHPEEPMVREDHLTIGSLRTALWIDLVLLENQLPYFILERLFDLTRDQVKRDHRTFRELVRRCFGGGPSLMEGQVRHFTDLLWRLHVDTLGGHHIGGAYSPINMYTADKLSRGGVKLVARGEEPSLLVSFWNGFLEVPRLMFDGRTEAKLRNIMALEQCHYPDHSYVSNHVIFLDCLIDTEKDVELLVEKGILLGAGENARLARIVNDLTRGIIPSSSYLADIAANVNSYYNKQQERYNDLVPILKRTYFPNLWAGTGTIAAAIIVLSTVGAFIVALIDLTKKEDKCKIP